jgi:uncharacterized caspase-like protein
MPPDERTSDRAVVIGIRRYGYAADPAGWINDLNGPDNDAADVAEWLRRADGGGLPDDNVTVVRSADLPDPFPDENSIGPAQAAVEKALAAVSELPVDAYEGQYSGRRLYLYVSGHGVAQQPDQAAVLTADAKFRRPLNVLVTSWFDWFYTAARFQEFVLWADCCATRVSATPKACDLVTEKSPNLGKGRRFVAFAAALDEKAVENQLDGKWHGVFTYTLLQGLNGAAGATVTSDNLHDYLHNNVAAYMRDDQRARGVAQEPTFGVTDAMTFATYPEKSKFQVMLRFPQSCVGKRAAIGVNASSPMLVETVLQGPNWAPELEAGIYVVFVPDLQLVQPFTVSGEGPNVVAVS